MNSLNRYADPVYCIARLIIGLMFACHGGQKILGFPPGGPPGALDTLGLVGAWIELAGGFLIAFGLFTRIAAFISAGEMMVAYFMAHHPKDFFPIVNKGELAVLYCWFFLFVVFYGPGRSSIDALIRGGARRPATAPT
jgi:putative oxidoreductase